MLGFSAIAEFAIGEYDTTATVIFIDASDTLPVRLAELLRLFMPGPSARTIVVPPGAPARLVAKTLRTIIVPRDARTVIVPPEDREVE